MNIGAASVASPCVNVCTMDAATGWCAGCLRNIDEIAAWSQLPDSARRAVWAQLPARRVEWLRLGRPAVAAAFDDEGSR